MSSRVAPTGPRVISYLLGGKVRSFLALAALGGVLAACGDTGTVKDLNVKDWVGANERQLLATWGRPHHSYPMVAGGKMIGYKFSDNTVEWIKSHPHTRVRNCMVNFETDARGTILDATATGTTCTIGAHDQMHPKKT